MPPERHADHHVATRRRDGGDHVIHITLLISILFHLLLWQGITLHSRTHADTSSDATLAISLLTTTVRPSTPPPPPHSRPHLLAPPASKGTLPVEEPAAAPEAALNRDRHEDDLATTSSMNEPLTPPRHDAAYLHNPEPNYPLVARRRHLEGTVVIRARIGPQGECLHTELHRSSGHTLLDQAALEAVGQWRFVPARRGSETVVAWVEVPVTFRLARL